MTALEAIDAGDFAQALTIIKTLSSKERRVLARDVISRLEGRTQQTGAAPNSILRKTLVAVGTASEISRNEAITIWDTTSHVLDVVHELHPPWLEPGELEKLVVARGITSLIVEALIEEGYCERPKSDALVEDLIENSFRVRDQPLADVLVSHPKLIEDEVLYRLFTIEGGPRSSLASADRGRFDEENKWNTALAELCERGVLDRDRLLDSCLDALSRDFAPYRASWFSQFHDRLNPSNDERAARVNRYVDLLSSSTPGTVSFAAKALERLQKKTLLPSHISIAALRPALRSRHKGTVLRVCKIVHQVATMNPRLSSEAIDAIVDGFVQPDGNLQSALLDTIESLIPSAAEGGEETRTRLAPHVDLLSPRLRKRLSLDEPTTSEEADANAPSVLGPFDDTFALKHAIGMDDALVLVSHALEQVEDSLVQELALDAIARHADTSVINKKRLGPIRKRAQTLLRQPFGLPRSQQALIEVVLAWFGTEHVNQALGPDDNGTDVDFYCGLFNGVLRQVQDRKAAPLLSTPTHRGGHLSTSAFLQRVRARREADVAWSPFDAVLAIMRLPADYRREARKEFSDLPQAALDLAAGEQPSHEAPFPIILNGYAKDGSDNRTWYDTKTHLVRARTQPESCLELRRVLVHDDLAPGIPPHWGLCRPRGVAMARFRATTTPDRLDHHFADGALDLGRAVGGVDNEFATAVQLEPARYPWVRLDRGAHWLVILALAAKSPRAMAVGMDVAVDGIAQKRLDPLIAGQALSDLLPAQIVKAKRLSSRLESVAAVTKAHASFVRIVLEQSLRGDPQAVPRDIASILSLLQDLLSEANMSLNDPAAKNWLQDLKRGGRVRQLKKSLLSM